MAEPAWGIVFYLALYHHLQRAPVLRHPVAPPQPGSGEASETYAFVKPWGPYAINIIGAILPVFRNMFEELERFCRYSSSHLIVVK